MPSGALVPSPPPKLNLKTKRRVMEPHLEVKEEEEEEEEVESQEDEDFKEEEERGGNFGK